MSRRTIERIAAFASSVVASTPHLAFQQPFSPAAPTPSGTPLDASLHRSAAARAKSSSDPAAVPPTPLPEKFRHVLEEHSLEAEILGTVNLHLEAKGVRISGGTIVDATIIHAHSSTKNREQSRDPEMHQRKKGKTWYFGMKAHVGVDSKTKFIHTAVAATANVSDVAILPDLLHGE